MLDTTQEEKVIEVNISVSADGMTAFLCLSPEDKDATYELDYLRIMLRESGVVFGVQDHVLEKIIEEKKYYEKIAVAKGEPPKNGKDGSYEFLFPTDIDTRPKILKDGSVDYGACGEIPSVQEGEEIVHYHPATKAQDGMDVYGEIVVGRPGKDLARLRGKGFILSEDNLIYTARTAGKVSYVGGVLYVDNVLLIDGDVSYATTGDIHFSNDIHIRGNVFSGMSITSDKGSIIVDGYVEGAVLVAKKDIILKNGMQGNGQGKIASSASVSGKFFEQAHIDCDGDMCANAIMNCVINCGQDVKVSGRFGAIIGGSISAMRKVDSMIIGNMAEVKTTICAGIEEDLFALLAQHERTQRTLQEEMDKIIATEDKLNELLEIEDNEDLRKKKIQITRAKIEKDSRMNEVLKRKQETLEKMSKANEARVTILKRVYPGTSITINGLRVNVKDEIDHVEYARRGGGIISYNIE